MLAACADEARHVMRCHSLGFSVPQPPLRITVSTGSEAHGASSHSTVVSSCQAQGGVAVGSHCHVALKIPSLGRSCKEKAVQLAHMSAFLQLSNDDILHQRGHV
jgi:hypothetical protein